MVSCQPVAAMRFGGVGNRFVSTTPIANDTLAPNAASTPIGSMSAPGRITTKLTPTTATTPTARSIVRGRRPELIHVRPATSSGWMPPIAAATPPGNR